MSMSHVVIICNKGEMNKQMSETIKIATDAMAKIRDDILVPQVNIIMNMLAEINEQTLEATIQGLMNAILEMDNG